MQRILLIFSSVVLLTACSPAETPDSPVQASASAADSMIRMVDGRPDLNGVWQAMNTANWNLEPHAAGQGATEILGAIAAMPPGRGVVEGGRIPYLPEALPRRDANYSNRRTEDPEARCFRPGVPRATYIPYHFQIFQSDSEIFIAYQYASATRTINMQDHMEAPFATWMGWSNGHWDGDTLVVEVTGLNGESWLDRSGNYVTSSVKVTERYTPRGTDHIWYEATIEDPAVYSAPWTISMPLYRHIQENPEFLEFKCVEFAEEMMYGHLSKPGDDNEGGSDND